MLDPETGAPPPGGGTRDYETLIHTIDGFDGRRRAVAARAAFSAPDETTAAHAAVNDYLGGLDDEAAMKTGVGAGARITVDVRLGPDEPEDAANGRWRVEILVDEKHRTLH